MKMVNKSGLLLSALLLALAFQCCSTAEPLRVHPENPRYFTDGSRLPDGSLKAVYLTGSHTWANLIDRGPANPPAAFDFRGYLEFLETNNQNFIRLWTRHVSWYHDYGEGELWAEPLPWKRSGPGKALDGKPKFDLTKFDDEYFQRLRERAIAAGDRGIYVSIMLFGGVYECRGGWRGNPFHAENNINKIDGDPNKDGEGIESHTLEAKEILVLQENYIKKAIDTVNDLDNVLFEISNEDHLSSYSWQCHLTKMIQDYERSKSKRHPVGMTALYLESLTENNRLLNQSPADWVSFLTNAEYVQTIFSAATNKVSILDSDHWFVHELYNNAQLGREWVWKAFCRGHNPILMEHLPPVSFIDNKCPLSIDDPGYQASRAAMSQTQQYSKKMNLAKTSPALEISSSGFCLANPDGEYLVYTTRATQLSLSIPRGKYKGEWFDPVAGRVEMEASFEFNGNRQRIGLPSNGEWVLLLKKN